MNILKTFFYGIFIALILVSCSDDPTEQPQPGTAGKRVYILNEGGFQKGNASIDVYGKGDGNLSSSVFFDRNSRPLGDILQSVSQWNSRLCWVVNNSGKIEITEKDLNSVSTISGMTSPRYMAVKGEKAYVTDLFSSYIWVCNLSAAKVVDSIAKAGWKEGIAISTEGEVWFAHASGSNLYRIDESTLSLSDSLQLETKPSLIVNDDKGHFWVLCSGDNDNGITPSLYKIKTSDMSIQTKLSFSGQFPSGLSYQNGKIYFVMGGSVYRIGENATEVGEPWLKDVSAYGLGVDPENEEVWVGNAKDFQSNAEVTVYSQDGTIQKRLTSGVASRAFYFEH